MKRILRTALAAAAVVLTATPLAACASTSPRTADSSNTAAPASGDITFWSALPGMDKVADAFNASQDRIHVTFQSVPNGVNGGYAKLASAISAGNAPDVATIEYYALPQFASSGSLVALDDHYPESALSSYSDVSRSLTRLGGTVWALPYDAPPAIVWYRKDLLDRAGVAVPTTWEQFADAARAVHKATGGYLVSFNANEPSWFAALAWQNGAQWFGTRDTSWVVDIAGTESVKVADYWQKLIDEGAVKAVASYSDEWTADIASGAAAGVLGASWSATSIKTRAAGQEGRWVAAELPVWTADAAARITPLYGGSTFAVPATSGNVPAAAAFIRFLTSDPIAIEARGDTGSAYLANSDLTAVSRAAFDSSFFANDIWKVFDEAASHGAGSWQWGPNFDVTSAAVKESMGSAGRGGDLSGALTAVQKATVSGLSGLGLSVAG